MPKGTTGMKCKHVQKRLVDYSENVLDEKTQSRFEEHLVNCPICTQDLHEIEHTFRVLRSDTLPEPPEEFWSDFTSKVMTEINKRKAPSKIEYSLSFPRFRMAMAIAGLIVIIGGLFLYFNAEIRQFFHPVDITADRSDQNNTLSTSPADPGEHDEIETALSRIASEDLMRDILEHDLALFDGATSLSSDIEYSDEMLYFLIHSLTEEEKKALLFKLRKIRDTSQ